MSGHSKWSNIKHKKEKTDAQRGKIFTKLGREISVAVKSGGPDPETNRKLKDVIAKARSNNMPNDNIQRVIKKASGDGNADNFENIVYEGYGPSGVAVIVETLTDNRNRTAGDMRHYFDKFGGNLGTSGSVAWMFDEKGKIIVLKADDIDEETIMMDALDAGAEDFEVSDEFYEITTDPTDFSNVLSAMEDKNYAFASAEVEKIPQNYIKLTDEHDVLMMEKLIEHLEDNDDVQNIFHNWEEDEQ